MHEMNEALDAASTKGTAVEPAAAALPARGWPAGWIGPFRRWRRLPLSLRVVVALNGLLLVFYTVLFPNYRGPDEPLHVDLIVASATGQAVPWPAPGTRRPSLGISAGGFITNGRIADRSVLHAEAAPARDERMSFRKAGGTTTKGSLNQLVQHPPLYYYLCASVLTLIPHWQDQPFDRVVALLRLANVLMLLPLPLVVYGIARRVGLTKEVGVAGAAFLLAVPGLFHYGAAVNNDNLLIPLLGASALVIVSVARGDVRIRTAALLGILSGLALLTKGFALFLPLTMGLGYAFAATRTSLRRAVLPAVTAMSVSLAVGGWWWVRNWVIYGKVQPDGTMLVQPHPVALTTWAETGTVWLKHGFELTFRRFWIDPGVTNVSAVLSITSVAASTLVLAGVLLSVCARRPPWRDSLLLILPFLCILSISWYGGWRVWETSIRPLGLQGRYLMSGLPGLAVLTVAGAGWVLGRRQAVLPILVLSFAGVMQVISGWLTMRVFWLPDDGAPVTRTLGGLRALVAWSPWPGPLVVLVMLGLLTAALGAVLVLVRDARSGGSVRASS